MIREINSKKLLIIILSLQLAWIGSMSYIYNDLGIIAIRQIIGFLYLTIIPGSIFLGLIRVNKLNISTYVMLSVGLSISLIMFIGASIDIISPYVGIQRPINEDLLESIISILAVISCLILFKTKWSLFINYEKYDISKLLFLTLPLLISILGTYAFNRYNVNKLLILLILLIFMTSIMIICSKSISENLYPFALFIFGISLLFHTSLVTDYIIGFDVGMEYASLNNILSEAYWNPYTCSTNLNSMLSISIWPEIYSLLLGINGTWIYKIIFPIIYSLAPVGLFQIYQLQLDKKESFISAFLFICMFEFYTEKIGLPRQQFAEFFLVLLLLMIGIRNISSKKIHILSILFGAGLITSHYGTTGLFIVALFFSIALIIALSKLKYSCEFFILSPYYIFIFLSMALFWYFFSCGSIVLKSFSFVGWNIITNSLIELGHIGASESAQLLLRSELSPMMALIKYMNVLVILLIFLGALGGLLKIYKREFNTEYAILSTPFLFFLFACIAVPGFAAKLNTARVLSIALIFLAPFYVLGIETSYDIIRKIIRPLFGIASYSINRNNIIRSAAIFYLAILLLVNTGLISELIGEEAISISLDKSAYSLSFHNEKDDNGAVWLSKYSTSDSIVQGSMSQGSVTLFPFFYRNVNYVTLNPISFAGDTTQLAEYVFLFSKEIIDNKIIASQELNPGSPRSLIEFNNSDFYKRTTKLNQIYSNSGSIILKS